MIEESEIQQARLELEPRIRNIKGLFQYYLMFQTANEIAKEYLEKLTKCTIPSKIAYSQSIIVSYGKPWTKNENEVLRSTNLKFLDHLKSTKIHQNLMTMRHEVVAHLDDGYEEQAVVLSGTVVPNDVPNPRRLSKLLAPIEIQMDSTGVFFSIDDPVTIAQIWEHTTECAKLTKEQTSNAGRSLLKAVMAHAPVLGELADILTISDSPFTIAQPIGIRGYPERNIAATLPKKFRLGQSDKSPLVAIIRFGNPGAIEIDGNGYKISVSERTDGSASTTVSFRDRRNIGSP